jgi:hypothetical protein
MVTGSFSGVRRPDRNVDHPPHTAMRLKEEKICLLNVTLNIIKCVELNVTLKIIKFVVLNVTKIIKCVELNVTLNIIKCAVLNITLKIIKFVVLNVTLNIIPLSRFRHPTLTKTLTK